jgi:hypothetical protein
MQPDRGLAGTNGLEALVYAGSYGLTPADGSAHPAGLAGSQPRGVAWPVRSGLVPPLADGLIARPETMPGLEAAVVPGAAVALVPGRPAASAPGWAGPSGKTQLVVGLAESVWQSRSVDLLAWVTATSRASILSGYAQAAAQLGLDHGRDAEAVAARFLAWLDGAARPWLVVLDDLRDAADLDGLWPAGPAGRVLITAADAGAVPGEHGVLVCAVPAFSIREGLNYLSGRLIIDPDQRNGAIDLADALSCEPAALAQASAVIISSGIRCREYRDYFIQQAQPATGGGEPPAAAGLTWTVSARHAEQLAPGVWTWRLLVLAALLDGHGIPGTVLTAPSACQYLAGEDAARPPDPQQAWSALLALERAGLVAVDATSAPPAVWVSPALQTAVRAVAPPELLDRAARAAADALVQAWPQHQPRSWLAAALRSCAVSLRRAAGDGLGRRLSSAAAGHGAEPGGRRTGRPRAGVVAGAGRGQRAAPRPGPPGHPGGRWPAGCRAAGRGAGRPGGDLVRVAALQPRQHARTRSPRHHRGAGQPGPRAIGRGTARSGARRLGGGGCPQRAGLRAGRCRHGGRAGGVRRRVAGRG